MNELFQEDLLSLSPPPPALPLHPILPSAYCGPVIVIGVWANGRGDPPSSCPPRDHILVRGDTQHAINPISKNVTGCQKCRAG